MAGFRHLLVHEYLTIDFAQVYAILQDHLDNFRKFAHCVVESVRHNGN
ncbi:MAG: DUF86 domain-containing protein [Firmicutes bacterium]|jgi:uncharacterized protein YutE (UPF0331/DUF86 family)|nr:DUF86 domain-containing protein [Bacillota bacterium]